MAHPCCECGGECYCSGDIDDAVVSKTPKNCEGCGCDEYDPHNEDIYDDNWDDDPPESWEEVERDEDFYT